MKKYILLVVFILSTSLSIFSQELVHPLDFQGTDSEKEAVIAYIVKQVKDTYTAIGMGDPATLRMMEGEELKAFKELTLVENRKILDDVIETYCEIGMCSYSTFLMMYEEQLKASKASLSW